MRAVDGVLVPVIKIGGGGGGEGPSCWEGLVVGVVGGVLHDDTCMTSLG